jgi:hypothetical protein
MAWLAWLSYTALFFFATLTVIRPSERTAGSNIGRLGIVDSLGDLCVDNIRTHSWWTYVVCLKRGVVQVHVDAKTKAVGDRIHIGEYIVEESSQSRQMYRSAEADCNVPNTKGGTSKVRRTAAVTAQCCDVVVHTMRQSRHTSPSKYATSWGLGNGGAYWLPDQVATDAAAEMRDSRSRAGYKASPATATAGAYIHAIEERTACNYDITICSDLACTDRPAAAAGQASSHECSGFC